jgi:hypothetical protein
MSATVENPLRRRLLAGATAALAAGAAIATTARAAPVALSAGAGDDAELIALVMAMSRGQEASDAINAEIDRRGYRGDEDSKMEVVDDVYWSAADRVVNLAATTPAGRIAKARAMELTLLRCVCVRLGDTLDNIADYEFQDRMALSLARDVLAGEAAA